MAVVGIGASAGGLKALQTFFQGVREDSGMAYVVIMHLDPERESRVAEILQDRTRVPVMQVTGATEVEANHVYIIPPGQDLAMQNGTICLVERGERPHHSPVDLFFRTLAEAFGPDAVGVVLSGTGSDGAAGIRHIKECGGISVAQAPEEAEYDGMPASAIATGQIDLVLPTAEIPAELLRLRRPASPLPLETPPADLEAQLAEVFSVLRGKTGQDFSLYKRSTVLRRLERRLRFNGAATLEDYLPVLRGSETEVGALLRDLLISVSSFFRDPDAFEALAEAMPAIFQGKGSGDAVRVWVVGCATGEEAYSIGILLHEHAAMLEDPPKIQIFATDIDEKGYAWGREALYPAAAVAEIPPDRLRRHFTQESEGYRVKKSLREGVLFAVHNVLQDPPFSRLDLISCRNLLIYLQPEAQERAIGTFHYALRDQGLLFLGSAESVGDSGSFLPVAPKQKIYRRDATQARVLPRLSSADPPPFPSSPARKQDGQPSSQFGYGALHLRLLERYTSASLVVDEQLEVVHIAGRAGEYLQLSGGAPSHNLMDLVRGDLRLELRTALYQAFAKGLPTTRRVVLNGDDGAWINIRVHPSGDEDGLGRYSLVMFEEQTVPATYSAAVSQAPSGPAGAGSASPVDEELRQTREQLESISAARHQMVADLESANQDLRSINEEQKASAEELETSREEIQSVNEELTTINQEHQSTIDELKRTNDDLQNLIESTEIGTIFLDRALQIRRFTPSAEEIFNFVETDQGRPLAHITHRLDYADLMADAGRVLDSEERLEREVSSDLGKWYIVRINPYRSAEGEIDGLVLTFFDNAAQKRAQEELREAKVAAESATMVKGSFLATMSHEFRTPLDAMLGYTALLDLIGPLTAGQLEKIERIKVCGGRLASMIDEILTFAKLDEGRETVRIERIDARVIAREAKVVVEPGAEAKHLTLILELPEEAVELHTDPEKACRILINLCGNAIKYTESGGIRFKVSAEEERVIFEVRDTGIGIALGDQPFIFDRFWRSDNATTRAFGGMGIGLAAAREFARLLGGDVEVESELGQGSTFRVWLPRGSARS